MGDDPSSQGQTPVDVKYIDTRKEEEPTSQQLQGRHALFTTE